ncbi:universal stress protein [Bacillus sp. 1P06AnD]|uniref:universal stress protein n=1 Tax=Bacillus sp. 1P06AnD TaxID=3132208 RepID=UPI00399F9E72
MYDKILVPYDGSESSTRALEAAIELAKSVKSYSVFTVLYVVQEIPVVETTGLAGDVEGILEEEGEKAVRPVMELLKKEGITAQPIYVHGEPAEAICDQAKQYDLVIMGRRGLGPFKEIVLGSVSHKVIQNSECPVMVVN